MKIKGFLVAIVSTLFPGAFIYANDDWAQFQKYQTDNEHLTVTPSVVFMGNSITEGWVKEDPQFFTDNNFIGRGISGQTTYQMLLRFRDDVLNLKPDFVVINGGTNDIAENNHSYNEERTLGNIISMTELAQANGVGVILSSALPSEGFYWRESIKNVPDKILSLNQRIKDYADAKGLVFIDYYPHLTLDGRGINPALSPDGVHPNLQGYKIMESVALPIIQNLLKSF